MSLKTTSIKRITKQSKLKLLIGKLAVKIAKEKNDPLAKKYDRTRKKYFDIKDKLNIKYGKQARVLARQTLQKSKD